MLSLAVTHHWIRSPSAICKGLPQLQRENPLHECCTCPKTWILTTFWWYSGRINTWQIFFFLTHESHSRGTARCIILLQFSYSPLEVWFVLSSVLWCVVRNPLSSRCSRLSRECDNFLPSLWNSQSIQGKLHFLCVWLFKVGSFKVEHYLNRSPIACNCAVIYASCWQLWT